MYIDMSFGVMGPVNWWMTFLTAGMGSQQEGAIFGGENRAAQCRPYI